MSERESLAVLQAKVRSILDEEQPDSVKGLLLENLIEQAYYTAKVEMATDALNGLTKRGAA